MGDQSGIRIHQDESLRLSMLWRHLSAVVEESYVTVFTRHREMTHLLGSRVFTQVQMTTKLQRVFEELGAIQTDF